MRKSPSAYLDQQLRGSEDFAAWYDSGIYLVRDGPAHLVLSVEHRGTPAPPPLRIRLASKGPPHLVIDSSAVLSATPDGEPDSLCDAVLKRLRPSKPPSPPSSFATCSSFARRASSHVGQDGSTSNRDPSATPSASARSVIVSIVTLSSPASISCTRFSVIPMNSATSLCVS